MYPDNYMNPMNNPMTNPNYGYNRMQQVQQMQRAINPQVPNMFGQVEQPQQMQSFISAVPVTCLEEAKAARIALDGSMSVFVNIQDGEIYTKQLSMNGLAELKTYKLVNPQENKIEYVTSNDFNGLNQRVQNIENFLNQLGGQQNESNAEVYDEVVDKLYKECYGEHFSDWLAEKAVENFKNVDGTEGAHWSVEQIDDVIRQYGIKCIGFNRWDLYFVMNMLYSDYYNVLGSDTATYVKMSKAWFEDPDVSEGKAYRYYMQVAKA